MRINKWLAQNTDLSRRKADEAIEAGRVLANGQLATPGASVGPEDLIELDNTVIKRTKAQSGLWMLNKPTGYVCSRDGQGNQTIYELLPDDLHRLNPVGRLDKTSSGLLLLTDDGNLLNELSHPSSGKTKVYRIMIDKPLSEGDQNKLLAGIDLEDGLSCLQATPTSDNGRSWEIRMQEGRNRQIRRTFDALGYKVQTLHRTQFGDYRLDNLKTGKISVII